MPELLCLQAGIACSERPKPKGNRYPSVPFTSILQPSGMLKSSASSPDAVAITVNASTTRERFSATILFPLLLLLLWQYYCFSTKDITGWLSHQAPSFCQGVLKTCSGLFGRDSSILLRCEGPDFLNLVPCPLGRKIAVAVTVLLTPSSRQPLELTQDERCKSGGGGAGAPCRAGRAVSLRDRRRIIPSEEIRRGTWKVVSPDVLFLRSGHT